MKTSDAHEITDKEYEEIPELPDQWFDTAEVRIHGKIVRKGRGLQKSQTKVPVSIRLSPEVVQYFKKSGRGWQTLVDKVLKDWVARHAD